ncbi:hypothetical protein GS399_07560 [Pedobacter sp. HMF7647]|uniref:LiaF transmembrane domain-containing protein n=1 Tax=Hufsiella arboris TaxID=2695275 RepID=A0A7K1Y8C6_9SPHI|nr:DUF5668 domain-containing protein [Hufsiella arboris]MXV50827.1 hypothetical protein [Hufsiella arboris]
MKTEKIVWGLVLVFIGGILLLSNFGVINFYWRSIWQFWPLILIIIGANMLFSRMNSSVGPIAAISITVLVLGFLTYQGLTKRYESAKWYKFRYDMNDDDDDEHDNWDSTKTSNTNFSEPFANTPRAELNITGGAVEYFIKDTTNNLFDADVKQKGQARYSLQKISGDSLDVLNFKMNDKKNFHFGDDGDNDAHIRLSTKPIWDINLKMGAGEANFDLVPYKIRNLTLKGGAAEFNVKVGMPQEATTLSAETGMADINISIPKEAGCKITVQTGLSSRTFDGFSKQQDGTYVTSNFNTSAKKIFVNLKGGLSDFEVSRY